MKLKIGFNGILLVVLLACNQVDAPKPFGPLPSDSQLAWQEMEIYGLIHYSLNTYTDIEWGYGDSDPELFNPTGLDCRQWAKVCKDAGLKGIIITAKHHDGFCLWPSKYTDYSVAASPWEDGRGDLLKELVAACKEYGLKFGVYLSPWDRNHADYGKPEYITYFRNQLKELLTNYGDTFEIWFDGANGGTGYYGGANENRKVDRKTYYDWENTYKLVYELQPEAILFSDAGPGCRWCGNEEGWVGETNWSVLRRDQVWPGYPNYTELRYGHEDGTHWVPAEVDVSVRPGWFYHEYEDHKVKSLEEMVDIYYNSVGRNATLLLNFPVDRRGLIHEVDAMRVQEMAGVIKRDFAKNIARRAEVEATNVRGNARRYSGVKVTDGKKDSYWATDDSVTRASLEIELAAEPVGFNRVLIQEHIRLGQRVKKFSVEAFVDEKWELLDTQTTIGYKRILRLPNTKATKIRINILDSKASPVISNVEVYNAPKMFIAPRISRNKEGLVSIHSVDVDVEIRYTLDGTLPNDDSMLYAVPFHTEGKVEVRAFVIDPIAGKSTVTTKSFDVLKTKWKVCGVGDQDAADANKMFDGNPNTVWHKLSSKMPIDLVIDLGDTYNINGFNYLPDQSRWASGIIFSYTFSLSKEGGKWEEVSKGEFSNIKNSPIMQSKNFEMREARYIKLTAFSNTDENTAAGYAELDIITE